MKVGNIYRTYDPSSNTLHWRINGAVSVSMLCRNGSFLLWDNEQWDCTFPVKVCQECEVQYVLEMMQ